MTDYEIKRIAQLLRDTDLTLVEIAHRMGRTRSQIGVINRALKIRGYAGRRLTWTIVT